MTDILKQEIFRHSGPGIKKNKYNQLLKKLATLKLENLMKVGDGKYEKHSTLLSKVCAKFCQSHNIIRRNNEELFTLSYGDINLMRKTVYNSIKGHENFVNEYEQKLDFLINEYDENKKISIVTTRFDPDYEQRQIINENLIDDFLNSPLCFYFEYNYMHRRQNFPSGASAYDCFETSCLDFSINDSHHKKMRVIIKDILDLRDTVDKNSSKLNEFSINYMIRNFEAFIPDYLISDFLYQLKLLADNNNVRFLLMSDNDSTADLLDEAEDLYAFINY